MPDIEGGDVNLAGSHLFTLSFLELGGHALHAQPNVHACACVYHAHAPAAPASLLAQVIGRSRIQRSQGHSTPEGGFTSLTPGLGALEYQLGQ
eukprot:6194016-Pleurochrysis_carterae.AAC.2